MCIIVNNNNEIILTRTKDGETLTLPGQLDDTNDPVTMAPSVSDNGIVWLSDSYNLVLINVTHMLATKATKVIFYRHAPKHGIFDPSLNQAGTVLTYTGFDDGKMYTCSVVCDKDNGEISLR